MFNIILFQPEIPPNTGNIIRLCANTGSQLHLIKPLGFNLEDNKLRRAGLDYHEYISLQVHDCFTDCQQKLLGKRLFAISTRGKNSYSDINYQSGDSFLFGPETRGLPQQLLDGLSQDSILRIPMLPNNRSLNLSNAVAVVVYEAWRQLGYQFAV
jgi:tRNA (cytidine/uridine-2'-O-)-methyltransferase